CFAEAGGEHSMYAEPGNVDELGEAVVKVLNDSELRKRMIEKGYNHAQSFRENVIAENIMKVYEEVTGY
ncbi:MAG: glycosyltransferase family 1 protein, partial [Bacteroidales bacterium]|nr:glycosyltransferase family 1 protein [Bacteroidales bacterium]